MHHLRTLQQLEALKNQTWMNADHHVAMSEEIVGDTMNRYDWPCSRETTDGNSFIHDL